AAERDRLFTREALRHIRARPDLFLLRTAARVRAYFGFDSYTASFIRNRAGGSRLAALAVLGLDATLYLLSAALAIGYACAARTLPMELRLAALTALAYSAPYFASFSHPTYHFPIVPLFLPFAAARILHPEPVCHPRLLRLALVVLLAIQIEWIVV